MGGIRFVSLIGLAAGIVLGAGIALAPQPASAQEWSREAAREEIDRFQLWNECKPVGIVVEGLVGPDEAEIGLTRGAIETAVRRRLLVARLYGGEFAPTAENYRDPYLYVNVNVVGRGFNVNVEYRKVVFDPLTQSSGVATSWKTGGTGGAHGITGADYIISSVSESVDEFIIEYLRVNADSCPR